MSHLQGRERATYVQAMFDRIARRYVLMNSIMTIGQDQRWRRYVVQQARLPAGGCLLDVATGTGDIAFEALRQNASLTALGADFSMGMLRTGQARSGGQLLNWVAADALQLPFPSASFDAVTSGYLARNVSNVPTMFREQSRVLKPGGRIVCLDTSPPPQNILQPFIRFYLRVIIPFLGRLIAGNDAAYTYLPESTEGFKSPEDLAVIMRDAGLVNVHYKSFMFGTMTVHVGERPQETAS